MTDTPPSTPPLTMLSDDEQAFYDSVVEFADKEVRPRVREMDEHGQIPRDLVDRLFALGVMGIEIPESLDGAGGRFFSMLAVEALSAVDPVDEHARRRARYTHSGIRCSGRGIRRDRGDAPPRSPRPCRSVCASLEPVPATTPSPWRQERSRRATTSSSSSRKLSMADADGADLFIVLPRWTRAPPPQDHGVDGGSGSRDFIGKKERTGAARRHCLQLFCWTAATCHAATCWEPWTAG